MLGDPKPPWKFGNSGSLGESRELGTRVHRPVAQTPTCPVVGRVLSKTRRRLQATRGREADAKCAQKCNPAFNQSRVHRSRQIHRPHVWHLVLIPHYRLSIA